MAEGDWPSWGVVLMGRCVDLQGMLTRCDTVLPAFLPPEPFSPGPTLWDLPSCASKCCDARAACSPEQSGTQKREPREALW